MTQTGAVLEVEGLCKNYREFSLSDVTFSVPPQSIMGFIGRNGAGKTTTIKSILNLVHKDAGSIRYFGMDLNEHEREIKQKIGYAAGTETFYKKKRIAEIVGVTKSFYKNWDDKAYSHYMSMFSIKDSKTPEELSEGMKVKLNLALALSHGAELLILDEPTSGLDPFSRDELCDVFNQIVKDGCTILFSTHITSDLDKCASHITYIRSGKIISCSSKADFIQTHGKDGENIEEIMLRLERESRAGLSESEILNGEILGGEK